MKKIIAIIVIIIIGILIIAGFGALWNLIKKSPPLVLTNFEECVAAGNPVTESYPRQCRYGNQIFVENIGNELEKIDLIRVNSPRPNEVIKSPLTIKGEARGNWFFEASFPVILTDWDGKIIVQGIATAKSEWMTADFVPFEAILAFTADKNGYSNKGTLILRKDNPSGLPENDDSLEIPVTIDGITSSTKLCSQEAMLCPDGSYVSRAGPNCEFAQCPTIKPITKCVKDSDCPSLQYICQETQGSGNVCPSNDPSCIPAQTTIAGECKLKEGNGCSADSDCYSGNLCYKNTCISPIGRQCNDPSDTSCPADFECVQECGPPVIRYPDNTPLKYFCQLKGYVRNCPICLAKNTLIDTPLGKIAVQNLQKSAPIWTVNNYGERVLGYVLKISKTPVPINHKMVNLVLEDGHTLLVSPGHPIIDGRTIGDLMNGETYNGSHIISANRVPYSDGYTYDILPSGKTGFYFANSILIDSTLNTK